MLYSPKKQKRSKYWGLRAAAVSVLLGVGVLSSSFSVSADTMSSLKQQYVALQQQQQQLQQQLNDQNSKLKTEQDKKAAIDAQVANTQKQIGILQAQIDTTNAQIAAKQKDIDATQKRVEENYNLLKQRMRALYMAGNESYLTALLSSDNLSDFLNNTEVIRTVSKHDNDIVNSLKADENKLTADKATLDAAQKELTNKQGTILAQRDILAVQQSEQAQAVANAQSAAGNAAQQVSNVTAQASQTDAQINALVAKQAAAAKAAAQAAAAAELKAQQQSSSGSPASSTNASGIPSDSAVATLTGFGSVNAVINYAESFQGYKYSTYFDGVTLDCSGFTMYVFAHAAGISLTHSAAEQYNVGTPVPKGSEQPGDLVFFNTEGGVSHVAIYVGNGQFFGAQSSGIGYASLSNSYWKPKYLGARRILN